MPRQGQQAGVSTDPRGLPATNTGCPAVEIFQVLNRLNVGGPAVIVSLLTSGLNENGMNATLITGSPQESEGDMTYYAVEHGVPTIEIPEMTRSRSPLSPLRDLQALFKLYRLMRRHRPTIVHTHTAIGGLLGRVAAILARVPIRVHTFHGHVLEGYYRKPVALIFTWLERFLARHTQRIIVLSQTQLDDLANRHRIAPPAKFSVVPLGFALDEFNAASSKSGAFRQELGINRDAKLVGIVGRLTAIKNHFLFLDAAARVSDSLPEIQFVIVGDGDLRPAVEQYARGLGISERVIFTGWRRDMPGIYADLDLLVISSDNEGTPLSAMEAMASGCPVLATSVGGMPDLIQDGQTGRLVPPRDADAMAEAMLALLGDKPEARRLALAGQSTVVAHYGQQRFISEMQSLYRELLAAAGIVSGKGKSGAK